ncbi:tyrosine-type recombinase/integrase [Pectobacterium aquaticum]|uniref:Site-specific integrase n=1 Tax=Pectobacterium aquaticum TaxID=2204145 RepID=A0A3R8V4U9_9GAMM|nr:tyrosine-type recombinase/integrase [Pectobacterium aquaticum]RRN97157.1 site-specific integrase [Pectobacterium aquaticum]RRO10208.1 site-specific integrase [Pectobacterium aquaticum]
MPVRKLPDGRWIADLYTIDRSSGKDGKRVRKKFATKGEALAFERYTLEQLQSSPWLADGKEERRLADLVELWFSRHGITLKDGEKRRSAMLWAADCMGHPLATEFSAQLFTAYRAKRLNGQLSRTSRIDTVTPRTVNLEQTYFLAVFNELKRLGEWTLPNPLENVRKFRTEESEMAYLTSDQIDRLLIECRNSSANDLEIIVKLCLATGARWSEAQDLRRSQVSGNKVTFVKTKGKKNRAIPIDPQLAEALPKKNGELFSNCYYAFRSAMERTGIELPDGQMTHVLRHTFASHFMMNGGNILVLQRILGHTDIKMTMRYAHFAPDHFEDAVRLNPLALCRKIVAPN